MVGGQRNQSKAAGSATATAPKRQEQQKEQQPMVLSLNQASVTYDPTTETFGINVHVQKSVLKLLVQASEGSTAKVVARTKTKGDRLQPTSFNQHALDFIDNKFKGGRFPKDLEARKVLEEYLKHFWLQIN